ncbi:MAG: hypothetical protein NTY20_04500 [Candidatus Aenigmarchaeota archaeon]|nr:hypothetical protein [Candidatus Aenigmarchaeota archaeon]
MKYQINEDPRCFPVPSIELVPGEKGKIIYASIYPRHSVIHRTDPHFPNVACVIELDKKLADCGDPQIIYLWGKHDLPVEELVEIREKERLYRQNSPFSLRTLVLEKI